MEGKMDPPAKKDAALGKRDPRKRAGAVALLGGLLSSRTA
jgi:hypothetical protein